MIKGGDVHAALQKKRAADKAALLSDKLSEKKVKEVRAFSIEWAAI